jgi:hypothetical protein
LNISANEGKGVFALSPVTEAEQVFLTAVKSTLPIGQSIKYDGRSGAELRSPYSERMVLKFKLGDHKLELQASSDESEKVVRDIRDAAFLSGGELVLQGYTEENGLTVEFCVTFCQHCKSPIIGGFRAHWKTCQSCSDKCSHEWTEGMVNNGGLPGYGEHCSKCGIGKPKTEGERERTKIEQELDIQNKLGVKIYYKGEGLPQTPEQAIEMNRLVKRYRRAKARR